MNNPKYIRTEDYLTDRIDDELMMMSIEQGMYYNLDQIGTDIWDQLSHPISLVELCDYLTGRYDVEPDVCRADVTAFLAELQAEGMIQLV